MSKNILLATWNEADTAYRVFSELTQAGITGVNQVAIIAKTENGKIKLKDADSNTIGKSTVKGGLIGMVVGVLGGPVGVLLGYSMGSLMGALADAEHSAHDEVVLGAISKSIPRSATALLVEANETDTAALDAFFAGQHAKLQRWDYDEVESEVESAVAAYENAASEVKKTIQAEKKHERQAARKQKWDEFKAKFLMQRSD